MYYQSSYHSPIGKLLIYADEKNLLGVLFATSEENNQSFLKIDWLNNDNQQVIVKTKRWLDAYFNHENPSPLLLPIKLIGTTFEQAVWKLLLDIPYGKIASYQEIGRRLKGDISKGKLFARAVGRAVGHNKIAIIIPCHRVIGSNGSLTGYAFGLDKKTILLKHEGIEV